MSYLSRRMREERRWFGVRGALAREREEALDDAVQFLGVPLRVLEPHARRMAEQRLIDDIEDWQPRGIDFRGRAG